MSYNGGVSFKGDKKRAREALVEALKLANIVAVQKQTAGLASLEKVFDIPGGTVRVVDNAYVRHMYIDVSSVQVEEEEEEDVTEIIEGGVYVVYASAADTLPVETDLPTPTKWALSPNANAVSLKGDVVYIAEQEVLVDKYDYNGASWQAPPTQMDWVSADGKMRLYMSLAHQSSNTRTTSFNSKYNYSPGGLLSGIYHRNNLVANPSLSSQIIGFGVFNGWLIWINSASPHNSFRIQTRQIVPQGKTYTVTGTTYEILAYNQQYQNQAYYGLDTSYSNATKFGSYWFNFAPDGSKATRARVFSKFTELPLPPVNGGSAQTLEDIHESFVDELFFSMDTTVDPPRPKFDSRTTVNGGDITTAGTLIRYGTSGSGMVVDSDSDMDVGSTRTCSIAGGSELVVASDYAASGVLAKLSFRLTQFTFSDQTRDYEDYKSDPFDAPESQINYWEGPVQTGSGTSGPTASYDEKLNFRNSTWSSAAELVYEADSTHTMPFYSVTGTQDWRYDYRADGVSFGYDAGAGTGSSIIYGNCSATMQEDLFYIPQVDGVPLYPWRYERTDVYNTSQSYNATAGGTVSVTRTMATGGGTGDDIVSALPCIDLRNGIFVFSGFDATEVTSGTQTKNKTITEQRTLYGEQQSQGPLGWTRERIITTSGDSDPNIDDVPMNNTRQYDRRDVLYILNPDVTVTGLTLPQVSGINTPGKPQYTASSSRDYTEDLYGERLLSLHSLPDGFEQDEFLTSLGTGITNGARVRGAGGSIAVQPGESVMFSVYGNTLYNGGTFNYPFSNQCKQATYIYTFNDNKVHVLTPLLWDSVEIDQDPIEPNALYKQYSQVGIIEWAAGSKQEVEE